ncbi:helix-turn-helix transcriptional regulator [Streptomyces sp. NPDC049555]|uniref:helix-turn-helix transcriptional regulator n=1 Tax=Streptomyces sp. NPDC049555 TaxID=3154930 RepID=UPI003428752C
MARPVRVDAVEVVTGADAVVRRLLGLRSSAVNEVCAMVSDGRSVLTDGPTGGAAVPRRIVVDSAAVHVPQDAGRLRVVDRIPAEVVIADRSTALVRLATGDAAPAALLVRGGPLLDRLVGLFEDAWRAGRPPRADDAHGRPVVPDPTDLAVLSLLLDGLTDASVAKQLGLGLRTVQRRVKRLMELAGVTTRLQLGWYAAERGWSARGGRGPAQAPASRASR